jgi:hypothetical protein
LDYKPLKTARIQCTLSIMTSFGLGASLSWIVSQSPCVIYKWENPKILLLILILLEDCGNIRGWKSNIGPTRNRCPVLSINCKWKYSTDKHPASLLEFFNCFAGSGWLLLCEHVFSQSLIFTNFDYTAL